ncbi:MAG: hypothetical protein ACYTDU_10265 [Planctomycetota bacterium]|jgi:tetratricopeptide (TPR) repeat protein
MCRTLLSLFLLASFLAAQDSPRDAYKRGRGMRGAKQKQFAAEQAAMFASTAKGNDHRFMGILWQWAGEHGKAADSFGAYLREMPSAKAKNRERIAFERTRSLADAKRYGAVSAAAQDYLAEFRGQPRTGWIRFIEGRAYRASGKLDLALDAFQGAEVAGYKNAKYETVDCLVQMSRYREATKAANEKSDGSTRFATMTRALPNLGLPLPKRLAFDYWAGTELATSEVKEKPALWAFWSTNGGKSRRLIHRVTANWAKQFKGKLNCIGPHAYTKFDPVTMQTVEDMLPAAEQGVINEWYDQYEVEYPLVLMSDNALHALCGVDPYLPALPSFAISDKKGVLRYARVGASGFELEAVEAMLTKVTSE